MRIDQGNGLAVGLSMLPVAALVVRREPREGRGRGLAGSVGLHAVVLAALLVGLRTTIDRQELPQLQVNLVFDQVAPASPPEDVAPDLETPLQVTEPKTEAVPPSPTAKPDEPRLPQPQEVSPIVLAPRVPSGEARPAPIAKAVVARPVSKTAPSVTRVVPQATLPSPQAVPQAAVIKPSVMTQAHPVGGIVGNCVPDYPAAALRRQEQGIAVVRVVVSPEGRAVSANIAQSSGHAVLDGAAVAKVLRDCRFLPASRDGVAIEGTALQPMNFRIEP